MIFKVVEYVKDFMLCLENIIGRRLSLMHADICLKILRLFLNSSSECSVFDLNQNFLVFFSGRTILIFREKCFSEISYLTMWMWTHRGTSSSEL